MTPHTINGSGKNKGSIGNTSNAPFDSLKPQSVIGASKPLDLEKFSPNELSGDPQGPNITSLNKWKQNNLREFGSFDCYAVFVVLPEDKQTIRYLKEFGKGLDLISGEDCLVITLGEYKFSQADFNLQDWLGLVEEHAWKGYSLQFAELFGVKYNDIPCLLVFKDVLLPEHLMVKLGGMEAEEIDKKMRYIFSIIREAVSKGKDPIQALHRNRNEQTLLKAGTSIISDLRIILGKSIDTAMTVLITQITTNPKI